MKLKSLIHLVTQNRFTNPVSFFFLANNSENLTFDEMDDTEDGFSKNDEDEDNENGDNKVYDENNNFDFDVEDLEAL